MTSWTNISKTNSSNSFLLKEDSFYLLLEDGGKIVLSYGTDWSNANKNSSSWTNINKS